MGRTIKVTLLGLSLVVQNGFSLNPIHESSYNIIPSGNFSSATTLFGGVFVQSQQTSVYDMPLGLALRASPRMEMGARFETRWGDVQDNVPYMVFGVKWLTMRHTSVQADLLVGTNFNTGKGFSLATFHKFQYYSWLASRLTARVGFMEALVEEDALMAFEAGFYPTIIFNQAISFEFGMIGSSQTKGFERYLAMDLQPAIRIGFAKDSMIETAIAIGLAGDRKEEMRVKVVLLHGI